MFSGVGIAYYLDAHQFLIDTDATYLSWVALSLFTVSSGYTTYICWKDSQNFQSSLNTDGLWFISEALMGIGMAGTIVGFIMMLLGTFQNLDVSDVNTIKEAISTMGTGMGSALVTTLVGLTTSMLLRLQIVNLER